MVIIQLRHSKWDKVTSPRHSVGNGSALADLEPGAEPIGAELEPSFWVPAQSRLHILPFQCALRRSESLTF